MWVGLAKMVDNAILEVTLCSLLHPKQVGVFEDYPDGAWPEVLAIVYTNESEFPMFVEFVNLEYNDRIREQCIDIAKALALHFACRTICDGSGFGEDDSPYWSIIWDASGQSYLADDCDTMFGDGEGGSVRIVRKINITIGSPNEAPPRR